MLTPQEAALATQALSSMDKIIDHFDHWGQIETAIPTLLCIRDQLVRLQGSHPGAIPQAGFVRSGDHRFLALSRKLLPLAVAETGEHLLMCIRQGFPGDLQQIDARACRKFVETPDNFWTVTIQPVDESYYFTIRGRPQSYKSSSLQIKSERGSYSRFKIRYRTEVPEALRLIAEAKARS